MVLGHKVDGDALEALDEVLGHGVDVDELVV